MTILPEGPNPTGVSGWTNDRG